MGWMALVPASPAIDEAPSREPMPVLDHMNRLRADPSARADLLAPPALEEVDVLISQVSKTERER